MYTFVTGGYRSGRSNYALRRASEMGPPPWLYVTAGAETDEAIRKRTERHSRDGDAIWRTAAMPADIRAQLDALDGIGAVVLDGFVAWIEARLGAQPESQDPALLAEIGELSNRFSRSAVPIVLVSTEMGLGIPPRIAGEQRLLKIASSANQILAANAGAVVMLVSGLPLRIR
jgi:adenosylcobinamide kinase/adenosylcobinamide-phosphate guanylyltransferase